MFQFQSSSSFSSDSGGIAVHQQHPDSGQGIDQSLVVDHDASLNTWKRLRPIAVCPECGSFTLSEVVVCRGTNIMANKGRWYQRVSNATQRFIIIVHLLFSPFTQCLNSKNQALPGLTGLQPRYRSCDYFKWRDDLGRMDHRWVDEVCSKSPANGGLDRQTSQQGESKCKGSACISRRKPRLANKSCSNGRCCRDCCERAQAAGAPECRYSSHNGYPFSFSALPLPPVSPTSTYLTAYSKLTHLACHVQSHNGPIPSSMTDSSSPSRTPIKPPGSTTGPTNVLEINQRSNVSSPSSIRKPSCSHIPSAISPYHVMKKSSFTICGNAPSPKKSEDVRFRFTWHTTSPSPVETLSLTAGNGSFKPFDDLELCSHLDLASMTSIQHLDTALGTWITILRSSPPIQIKDDSHHHFKGTGTSILLEDIIGITTNRSTTVNEEYSKWMPRPLPQTVKEELGTRRDAPAVTTEESPSKKRTLPWDGDDVGCRPCKLAKYGRGSVGEMDDRLEWMHRNRSHSTLIQRYDAMFKSTFKSSTFHHHRNAWTWLRKENRITPANREDSWLGLARHAWAALNEADNDDTKKESDAVIDLTREEDEERNTTNGKGPPAGSTVKTEAEPAHLRTSDESSDES